jgi:MoaA/NifB/PqqE/SkfB family radical SAM enzyme
MYPFNKSKTFCILPWIHMATLTDGRTPLCCIADQDTNNNLNNNTIKEIWNSKEYKFARKNLLKGERIKSCMTCFNEEDNGVVSHRMTENNIWRNVLGKDYIEELTNSTTPTGYLDNPPITLDLRLGNTCNSQCIMCRPQDSSKWVSLGNKLLEEFDEGYLRQEWKHKSNLNLLDFEWYKNKEFWNELYELIPNIQHIIFGGGEPLYIEEHYNFIDKVIEMGESHHISLRYHTNGTIMNKDLIRKWKKFDSVEVMLSIDAYSTRNDYIRYPSKWKSVRETMKLLEVSSDNVFPKINTTVSLLNVFYLNEFAQWMIQQNFKKISKDGHNGIFFPSILHYPEYLSVTALRGDMKNRVVEELSKFFELKEYKYTISKFKQIINFMNSKDNSKLLPETKKYLNKLDEIRNTSYKETFKELEL